MPRHRHRYTKTKCNPASPPETINDVKARDQLDVLERISLHHRQVLKKMKPLKWGTQREVYLSLRAYLYWKMHWLDTRRKLIDVAKQTQEHYAKMKEQFGCHHPGYLITVSSGQSVGDVNPEELTIHRPRLNDYLALCKTMDRHNKILADLQLEYTQMEKLLRLPEWRDISQHVCHGGRLAYSVALACATGTLSRNKAPQHKIFGWNISGTKYNYPEDKDHPMFRRVREVMRGMHARIPPTKGPRPSMLEGWEVLNKSDPYVPHVPPPSPPQRFKDICRSSQSKGVVEADDYLYCHTRNLESCTPLMVRYIREEVMRDGGKSMRIRNKIVRKIMQLRDPTYLTGTIEHPQEDGSVITEITNRMVSPRQETNNAIDTIFLAMPTHVGGDDYIVPAIWSGGSMSTTTGWVYMRRGWPDMYHAHILPTVDHDDEEVRMPDDPPMPAWTVGYKWLTTPQKLALIESMPPDPEAVHLILENGSRSFFNRTRSAELKKLTQKQRYARVLVKLRRLPCLTRNDSYGIGNCKPGTEKFINQLAKLAGGTLGDGTIIDGRKLAYYWYKGKYIEEDRFTNVVNKLYEPYQAELNKAAALDAALDQRIAECMESEGWNPHGAVSTVIQCDPYVPMQITAESQIAPDGSFIDLRSLPVQG